MSVLMSLYWRERPEWLRESLESVWGQEAVPREVVLVLDGDVGDELKEVVKDFEERSRREPEGPQMRVVRLAKNVGLGRALAEGLRHCGCELVARMDTDDIMVRGRIGRQYDFMVGHGDVDVCGAWIDEFRDEGEGGLLWLRASFGGA